MASPLTTASSNVLLGLSRDYWMDDELCKECYDCKSVFTTWRRKHHCRICGALWRSVKENVSTYLFMQVRYFAPAVPQTSSKGPGLVRRVWSAYATYVWTSSPK